MARPIKYKLSVAEIDKHLADFKSASWMSKNVFGCSKGTVCTFMRKNGYKNYAGFGWRKKGIRNGI
jgi:hypothetical protein